MNTVEMSITELEGQSGSELPTREEFALVPLLSFSGAVVTVAGAASVIVSSASVTAVTPVPLPTLPTLPTLPPIPGLPV